MEEARGVGVWWGARGWRGWHKGEEEKRKRRIEVVIFSDPHTLSHCTKDAWASHTKRCRNRRFHFSTLIFFLHPYSYALSLSVCPCLSFSLALYSNYSSQLTLCMSFFFLSLSMVFSSRQKEKRKESETVVATSEIWAFHYGQCLGGRGGGLRE